MSENAFVNYIRLHRPNAQFIRYVHSDTFEDYSDGVPFYYVTLYDEDINSSMIQSSRYGTIIIENTYLYSFSYNLLVSWLTTDSSPDSKQRPGTRKSQLVKYNLKKFFAEQLLRLKNCVFARALFLETLLFEERSMLEAFETVKRSSTLTSIVLGSIRTMSQITRLHELNHRIVKLAGKRWYEFAAEYGDIARTVNLLELDTDEVLFEEMCCDVMAVIHDFRECQNDEDRVQSLRSTLFGFATFAIMASLELSAAAMICTQPMDDDVIDLASRERVNADYHVPFRSHEPFLRRIGVVFKICEALANRAGIDLYDTKGPFVVPSTIFHELFAEIQSLLDGHDENARKMSHLVAISLHRHPDGFAFLYQVSKTHRRGGDSIF